MPLGSETIAEEFAVVQAVVDDAVGEEEEVGCEGEGPCPRHGKHFGDGDADAEGAAHCCCRGV